MATKLGRVVTCGGGTQLSKSRDLLILWSCDMKNSYISTSATPMTIKPVRVVTYGWKTPHTRSHYLKLGRVVTCDGGSPPSKSSDLLIMWPYAK